MDKTAILIVSALLACIVTIGLTRLLRRLALKLGWVDIPGGHKHHEQPVPFVGGWSATLGIWAGVFFAYSQLPELENGLSPHLPGLFLAHLVILAGGIADDFKAQGAFTKLLLQAAAALILVLSGLHIDTIYVPFTGSYLLGDLTYPATILWVWLIVNAVNVVDGLDGLASGLTLITSIGLLYTGVVLSVPVVVAISVVLIGSLLGFLPFNFPRATVFLGDSGSQSLGFAIAVMAIYCPIKSYTVVAMFVPLLALGVPLIELGTSALRRLATGQPLFKAERGHLFYRLARRQSSTLTVVVFCAIALALQVFVFALFLFDRRIVFSILVAFMLIIAAWFWHLTRQEDH